MKSEKIATLAISPFLALIASIVITIAVTVTSWANRRVEALAEQTGQR